ncbi:Polycystin-2 [Diplonema papillatum]|nr:Polycystin-2 [Diplonema papillatum]
MEASSGASPFSELRLGMCRKENLFYRLTGDPDTANAAGTNDPKDTTEGVRLISSEDQAAQAKRAYGLAFLKETVVFLCFLGIFVAVIVLNRQAWAYESAYLARRLLGEKTGYKLVYVTNTSQFVNWTTGALLPELYPENDASGAELDTYDGQFFRTANRVLGPIRLRQVRLDGDCNLNDFDEEIPIFDCAGDSYDIASHESREAYSYRWVFPNGTELTEEVSESEKASRNITQQPSFRFSSSEELCSEVANPERDIGSTVDRNARSVTGSNSGLRFYCELAFWTKGDLNIAYPKGGFVLDLPPPTWYTAWGAYRSEKLRVTHEWNTKHGPQGEKPYATPTETQTPTLVVPPTPTATLHQYSNASETWPVPFVNVTPTLVVPTETEPIYPTVTPVDTMLYLPDPPSKREYSEAAIRDALDHDWIDNRTAMILVEFTTYNPNVNMLTSCRIVFEFLSTGQVAPYMSVKPMVLPQTETAAERLVLMLEIVLVGFIAWFAYKETLKVFSFFSTNWRHCQVCSLKKIHAENLAAIIVCPNCQRPFEPDETPYCPDCYFDVETSHRCWKGYFLNLWNIVDLANIIIFVVVFGMRFKLRSDIQDIDLRQETQFIQFFPLSEQFAIVDQMNAGNVMLSFIKTMKYLGRIRALSSLVRTLVNAATPLLYFMAFFGIVYLGFSVAFLLAFGKDLYDFRTISASYMTLLRVVLGSFDYGALKASNHIMAPLLFLVYNTFVGLIILNIFISILDIAYGTARVEVQNGRTDYLNSSLRVLFRRVLYSYRMCIGKKDMVMEQVLSLTRNILKVTTLTKAQRDQLRGFMKTVVEEDDKELLYEVLRAFHQDVNRVMRGDDYHMLMMTVKDVAKKQEERAVRNEKRSLFVSDSVRSEIVVDKQAVRQAAEARRAAAKKTRSENASVAFKLKALEEDFEVICKKVELLKKVAGLKADDDNLQLDAERLLTEEFDT